MKRLRGGVIASVSQPLSVVGAATLVFASSAAWAQTSGGQSRQQSVPPAQNQNQNASTSDRQVNQQPRDARAQAAQTQQGSQPNARGDQFSRGGDPQSQGRQSNDQQDAAWLGVFLNQRQNDRGAAVSHVYPAGPAARAGIEPGDVIQQVNGHQVSNGDDLVKSLDGLHPGDKAEITVTRNNEPAKLTATLGSRDSYLSRGRGFERFGGPGSAGAGSDESSDFFNFPLHAMELEHNRRNAEQHQRIENEIAKLREEVHQLREALQRR